MATFKVSIRNDNKPVTIEADDVHVTPTAIKFINGKKSDAQLVAVFNAADVTSVIKS